MSVDQSQQNNVLDVIQFHIVVETVKRKIGHIINIRADPNKRM